MSSRFTETKVIAEIKTIKTKPKELTKPCKKPLIRPITVNNGLPTNIAMTHNDVYDYQYHTILSKIEIPQDIKKWTKRNGNNHWYRNYQTFFEILFFESLIFTEI